MGAKKVRKKHIPLRTCIVCRSKRDKRQLIRIVRTSEGAASVDPSGKQNGRGAYLCEKEQCWNQALYGSMLDRALNIKLSEDNRRSVFEQRPSVQGLVE